MEFNKIKILYKKEIKDGDEIPLAGKQFLLTNSEILVYDIERDGLSVNSESEDPLLQVLQEQARKELEQQQEFLYKFQIRTGQHLFDAENGMIVLPVVDEAFFETSTSKKMEVLFKNFFDKSHYINEKYKKNKRAYLLYSEPGMGKSALIKHFCKKALKEAGTAVVHASGEVDFQKITNIFLKPYAEDVKKIVLVIEDFGKKDYGSNTNVFNPSCLNFLDGVSGLFRVPTLILCTTNFIKELGPQLTNRPGRFSKLIQVLPPSDDEVFALIEGISDVQLTDKQKSAFRGLKMSPDHIVEALVRHELEGVSLELAAQEVMQERSGLTQWK
jgi:uncharacterized protein (UPF0218 family)